MRRPGGAVAPAMKPTTGFLVPLCLMKSAATISLSPPISPIMIDRLGLVILQEHLDDVHEVEALHRVAADADAGALAEARGRGLRNRLIGQRAGAADDADLAAAMDMARHDADLAGIGRDDAGAVGADENRLRVDQRAGARFTMSSTGMPSVMQTMSGISASIASRIESAANGGGT